MHYSRVVGKFFVGFLLCHCIATPAGAIPVAVVGPVDHFLSSARLPNSGTGAEESWVSAILGFAVNLDYRNATTASAGWEPVNGSADHWAHGLAADPAYYLLKLGVGNRGADTHYLYQNIANLSWAVIDLSDMLAGQNLDFNFGRISHISKFDGTITLSEPGSFGMLIIGFGLLVWLMAKQSRYSKHGYPSQL